MSNQNDLNENLLSESEKVNSAPSNDGNNAESHLETLDEKYGLKKCVFRGILFVISLGALGPYIAECIISPLFPGSAEDLSIWNQYVGIILGVVATVVSIVSMIMGFRNFDETLSLQQIYLSTLNQITLVSQKVEDVKTHVSNLDQGHDTSTSKEAIKDLWNEEPPEEGSNKEKK